MEDGLDYRVDYRQEGESRRAVIPALSLDVDVPEGADATDLASRAARADIAARLMRGEKVPMETRQARPVARSVYELPEGAMTLGQVQERLGVTQSAVSKLISRGRLEAVSYDGRKYVTPEALAAYEATGRKRGRPVGYGAAQIAMKRYCEPIQPDSRRNHDIDRGEGR